MSEPHKHQDCLDLAERLSEYLDDELPEDLQARVEDHFDGCVQCERFLVSLTRVKGLGHLLPEAELSPERLRALSEAARRALDG